MPRPLAPSERYPAGDGRVQQRMVELASRLRVRVVECGPASGPAVLCIHGWAGSSYSFRKNLPVLAAAGYRAISVDLKGHGLSDKPLGEAEYTTEALRAHILEILDALSLDRPTIVAHSLGGAIATDLACVHPARVARLALLAPAGFTSLGTVAASKALMSGFGRRILRRTMPRWIVRSVLSSVYGTLAAATPRDVEEYRIDDPAFALAMRDILHAYTWDPLRAKDLSGIWVPVLVIFGTLDRLINGRAAAPLLESILDVRVRFIEGCGHVVAEEAPEIVNDALLRFLEEGASRVAVAGGML